MTKRTRGSARAAQRRPGTRPPATRSARGRNEIRPRAEARSVSQLDAATEIAEEVVEERPAAAADELERAARAARAAHPRSRVKPGSVLAARAATEYVYVAQDIRRIAVVTSIFFGIMLLLYVLIVVLKVIPLPFY